MAEKTRKDDLLELEILHLRENKGLQGAEVMARLRCTRGQISGLQKRVRDSVRQHPCQCKLKRNRDGGMRPLWWRS